jgi:hypothetical protein
MHELDYWWQHLGMLNIKLAKALSEYDDELVEETKLRIKRAERECGILEDEEQE